MSTDSPDQVDLLRWWHQYQAQLLNQEADLIRNGVLQEMFAMRRQLETSRLSQVDCPLTEIKRMYALIETLSDRLDPPYLQDSIPLALQHAAEVWRTKLHLTLALPSIWESEPLEQSRLLILLTENLLQQIATADILPDSSKLTLQYQADIKELIFYAQYKKFLPSSLALKISQSLQPFLNTFQLFTHGDYNQDVQPQSLKWALRWESKAHS